MLWDSFCGCVQIFSPRNKRVPTVNNCDFEYSCLVAEGMLHATQQTERRAFLTNNEMKFRWNATLNIYDQVFFVCFEVYELPELLSVEP